MAGNQNIHKQFQRSIYYIFMMLLVLVSIPFSVYIYKYHTLAEPDVFILESSISSGNEAPGLIQDKGYEIVESSCTSCHSARLVTQNKATREGWERTIRWMQKTQNLWDLGDNEDIILDYLTKNYGPEEVGRRQPLENIEWYQLKQ